MDEPYSAASLNSGRDETWFSDIFTNNRAISSDIRESQMKAWEANVNSLEASKARQFEENMSNTAIQRRADDLKAAGFSPLAAIGNGAATPSAVAGSVSGSSSSKGSSANPSGIIGSMIAAGAMIATKGMSLGVQSAAAASATAATNKEISSIISLLEKPGISDEVRTAGINSLVKMGAVGRLADSSASNVVNDKLSAKERLSLFDRVTNYDQTEYKDIGDEKIARRLLQDLLDKSH